MDVYQTNGYYSADVYYLSGLSADAAPALLNNEALEPFYTTKEEDERSGMGFTIMKSFMDDVSVISEKGKGTKVYMSKKICQTIHKEDND